MPLSDEELEELREQNLESAVLGVGTTSVDGTTISPANEAALKAIAAEEHRRAARTRGGPLAYTLTKAISRGLQ